jgi:hypothetical protein
MSSTFFIIFSISFFPPFSCYLIWAGFAFYLQGSRPETAGKMQDQRDSPGLFPLIVTDMLNI